MSRTETRAGASTRAAHLGPAVRRPLVLDAALAVWDHEGYRGTTMAAIAAEAGVSKPVLYECFDNKDDVLRALLDREEERPDVGDPGGAAGRDTEGPAGHRRGVVRGVLRGRARAPGVVADRRRRPARHAHGDREPLPPGPGACSSTRSPSSVRRFAPGGDQLSDAEAHVVASNFASLAEDNASLLLRQEPGPDAWTPEDLAAFVTRVALGRWIG